MVQVSMTTSVKVEGGPSVPLGTTIQPESYTFASVTLGPTAGADATQDVALLPPEGVPVLLAVRAWTTTGAAQVTVTPKNGAKSGPTVHVDGVLLVAGADILAALVDKGPRSVTVANPGSQAVTVDILACLDPPPHA
jgi:hypothetical protein